MSDYGSDCNFDDGIEFPTTNENEMKGDTSSSPQTVRKINTSDSRQLSRKKSNKNVHRANDNLKQKEETTPSYFIPTKPREFIGFYVCKEYNGARVLGIVISHDNKNNLLKVQYEDTRTEYLKEDDVRKIAATKRDIIEAQQALLKSKHSDKKSDGKAKRASSSEESTARKKKKGNISTGAKI